MSRKNTPAATPAKAPFQISKDVLEQLIPGPISAEGVEAIFQQLKKALLERALNAEVTHHLGNIKPRISRTGKNGGGSEQTTVDKTA